MKNMRKTVFILIAVLIFSIPMAYCEDRGTLELNDAEQYAVNLFLSNFTEIGIEEIDTYGDDDKALVDFAHDHIWVNDKDSFESGNYNEGNNRRVSDDRIQNIIDDFFFDAHEVDLSQTRFYYDGEFYYHTENGESANGGFAMNTGVCPIEDGYYFVSFMIFADGSSWDNSALNLKLEDAWGKFGHPCGYGSALIFAEDLADRDTYKMVTFGTI